MKLKYALLLIPFLITQLGFAQASAEKLQQIKQLKIGFITTEIDLTTSESTKFWPVYNEYQDRILDLIQRRNSTYDKNIKGKNVDKLSETDAKKVLEEMEEYESKILDYKQKMNSAFEPIIGSVKTIKLRIAEENFKRKLLNQYRKNK